MPIDQDEFVKLDELDAAIKLGEAVKFLYGTREFKLLLEEYVNKQAISLTKQLGTLESMVSNKDNVTRRLESIGLFNTFLETVLNDADTAENDKRQILKSGEINEH